MEYIKTRGLNYLHLERLNTNFYQWISRCSSVEPAFKWHKRTKLPGWF